MIYSCGVSSLDRDGLSRVEAARRRPLEVGFFDALKWTTRGGEFSAATGERWVTRTRPADGVWERGWSTLYEV